MKATELRIGNLVEKSLKSGNGRKVFDKIRISDINHIYEKDGSFNYEPIPLTEEILLKCGFYKTGISELYYPTDTINISWVENDPTVIEINDENIYCYIVNCEYLHILQNVFFALKGQELEINL